MKIRNPRSRFDIKVKSADRVLEVGGGHNPHPRSNVVVDKFSDSNYHRSGNIKIFKNQVFQEADGENLPFKDNEFDYVICNHVLEHVDNPARFLQEQSRVAKRGYLETPSFIGEHLIPKVSHRWLLLEIDNQVVMVEKEKVKFHTSSDFGDLFLDYLPKHSLGYKILQRTHSDLLTVRHEWKDNIDYVINPDDPALLKYFTEPWTEEIFNKMMVHRSLGAEALEASRALFEIAKTVFKSKVLKA
jgi:SAM-dependent methyltransferase